MINRIQAFQLSRPARTRISVLGCKLSTLVAVVAGSAALLAGSAAGSPIHPYSHPSFPGHGRHESGAGFSAPRFPGFFGHPSLEKILSRRWKTAHSWKAAAGHGVSGFGRFDHEEPFHCAPDPIDPAIIDPGQEPEPEAGPILSNPSLPPAVPEPGTWILFVLGIAGLLGLRGLRGLRGVRKSRAP